jgi:hypothetical protein
MVSLSNHEGVHFPPESRATKKAAATAVAFNI